jgi:hypothetical protein
MPRKPTKTQERSLTADERETVILMDDGSNVAKISTHQKRIYTKLRNNPAAKFIEDITCGASIGGMFEIPANLISFRTQRKVPPKLSAKQKEAAKERARAAGAARRAKKS